MAKTSEKNLGYLGEEFQYRLVKACIEDKQYFRDLNSIIDQNMFTDCYLRVIVGIMKEYFADQSCVPSYELLEMMLNNKALNNNDRQFYREIVKKLRYEVTTEGYNEIEEMAYRFFYQQETIKLSNELKTLATNPDNIDICRKIMNDALSVTRKDYEESDPFQSIEDDLSTESVVKIPTGVYQIDKYMGGGLDKGKTGLIICPMGCGKTTATTCFSYNAATSRLSSNDFQGFKVLQIVFEDSMRDMRRKYICRYSEIEQRELNSNPQKNKEAKQKLKMNVNGIVDLIHSNIRVLKFESGEKSATDMREVVRRYINSGFKPDMVIIDYFECLACERGMEKCDIGEREGKTMRKLENMAKEFDIALWVTSQGNRESITAEATTNEKIGGSIKKNQIASVVIGIARSMEDIAQNRATLSLNKNRSGMAGLVFNNTYFNNGTCKIQTNDCDTVVEQFDKALSEQQNPNNSIMSDIDEIVKIN